MIRVLSFSTLYPNPADPRRGAFLAARIRALREHAAGDVDLRVVAPVPYYPRFLPGAARWKTWARAPRSGDVAGAPALFPRYLAIPGLGVATHVGSLALAARRAARAFASAGTGFEPDLVEAHFLFPDGAAAVALARSTGRPVLLVARGTDAHTFPRDPKLRPRVAAAVAGATGLAAVSDALARDVAALAPGGARVAVIRNGVDAAVFRPVPRSEARAALGLPEGATLVLAVGRLTAVKRPALVAEALAALASATQKSLQNGAPQDDTDVRGIVVGSGELEGEVRALAARLGARLEIRPGDLPPERLALHYAAADVLVHASEREGCPNVVIEALACGVPVAATPSEGVREALDAASRATPAFAGGFVAEADGAAPLAAAIRRALAARPDRAATARAAASAFRWEEVARRTVELYRETLRNRPRHL